MQPDYKHFKKLAQRFSLVKLHGKDPSTAEGHGWQRWCEKKRSFEEIGFKPGHNAGIACGPASQVIVLDEDDPELFQMWLNGKRLPETRTHQTGSGTRHFLFQYPLDGKKYGNRCFKHGDITICDIKGIGGQVVAPGSIHPQTGKPYTVLHDVPIAPAPEWLLTLAAKEEEDQAGYDGDGDPDIDIASLPVKERTKQFILQGKPKGARSEPIMTVCNALVWANLKDAQIFRVFEQYPIGEKYRQRGQSRFKWLQTHIFKARAKIKNRAKPKSFHYTDLGNAERFAVRHHEKVRFCHAWGKWLVWDGKRWKMDATAKAMQLAKETVRSIYAEAADSMDESMRKSIAKWAASSEARNKIEAMMALAKSEPGIPVEPHELDADQWLFNCLNGTIDLRTGVLRPHNPGDLITKLAPVSADPNATAPMWMQFQNRITDGNKELIQFKQRMYGSALTADVSDQCLFLLYGTGANGKSTELETIKTLLGDYGKTAEFSTFIVKKNDAVRNDIADLRGARFVCAIETERSQRLAESVVKQMTGGDTLKARFLFQEHFEFKPTFKIFLAANHKPIINGTDYGIWRRIKLIPFKTTIPEAEWDRQLGKKLRRELSGILNWLLVGCAEWQENGLGTPQDVEQATDAYRDEMDTLSDFLRDCCLVDQRCRVSKKDLYDKYQDWCGQNGEEALTKRVFSQKMTERSFWEERSVTARFWRGIGMLEHTQGGQYDAMT